MADELNIPTHRWYEKRNHIALAKEDYSRQYIYDSGIQKIDAWINSQPWGNQTPDYAILGLEPPLVLDFDETFYRTGGTATDLIRAATHTRAGNATMVDSDGVLKWAPHNLVLYSTDATAGGFYGTLRTSFVDGTSDLTLIEGLSDHAFAKVTSNVTTDKANNFKTTSVGSVGAHRSGCIFYAGTHDWFYLGHQVGASGAVWFNAQTGLLGTSTAADAELIDLGGGFYQVIGVFEYSSAATISVYFARADGDLKIDGTGTETIYLSGFSSQQVSLGGMTNVPEDSRKIASPYYVPTTSAAVYLPRVGHHLWNGTAWVDAGYFHESEARTNLLTYSEDFTDASWGKTNTATLALDATGPFGVANSAVTLVDSGATGTGQVIITDSARTVSTSTAYTWSMYAKAGQLSWLSLRTEQFTTPVNGNTYFDLSTGTLGTVHSEHSATIEDVGAGWYRCAITFTTDAADTAGNLKAYVCSADLNLTVDLDGTSSILIYGAQFEAGSTPSSYIPTAGSTVTRAADVMTIPAANLPWPEPEFIGPELVTNGDFAFGTAEWLDTTSGTASFTVSSGVATLDRGDQNSIIIYQSFPTVIGETYKLRVDKQSGFTIVRAGTAFNSIANYNGSNDGTDVDTSFIATATETFVTLTNNQASAATLDNISVREINPIAVSIQMSGTMTYADDDLGAQVIYNLWQKDADNFIRQSLVTVGGAAGNPQFIQRALGVTDDLLAGSTYSPGINVPFNIASRHGYTFLNGAVDGAALTANLTPTALPDLETTDMKIASRFNGTIDLFRMWEVDITDEGIAEAST